MDDNKSVKKAQKAQQKKKKVKYTYLKASKKEAGAKGIGVSKFATKSAEGTQGGGRVEVTKKITTKHPIKRTKFKVEEKRTRPSDKKKAPKNVKITQTVGTGEYKSMPFKKKKNA